MTQQISKRKRVKRGPRQRKDQLNDVGRYAQDAYSLGKRTIQGLSNLRKLINIEFKRFDINSSGGSTSQAGVVSQLSQIAQGTDNGQRIGNSIRLQKLKFTGHVLINGSATRSAVRIVIARDLENTGSAPAGSDLLVSAGGSNCVTSNYSYTNRAIGSTPGRFTVIYDSAVALSVTGNQNALVKFEAPLNTHVRYSGSAGANTREGSLWVFAFCNEATNTATIDWNAMIEYTDD